MSEDPDFEMEVVEGDELNGPAGGESSPEMEEPDRTEVSRETGPEEREGASMLTAGANGKREWGRGPLEVVSNIIMGSSPKSKYYNESEEGPPFLQANNEFGYRSPTADRWCSNPAKRCEKGDLLMTIRGTYVGQMNLADDDYCIGRGLAAIAPGDDLNGEYLFHYLDHIESYVKSIAAGSTFDSVSSNDIESLEVRIPPLPEQRKIASVLYAVDQAIQKTEAIIEQAKRVKRGLMQDLWAYGLDGIRESVNSRESSRAVQETTVGQFPKDWKIVNLDSVTERVTDGTHQAVETLPDGEEGIPFLYVSCIRDGQINWEKASSVSEEVYKEISEGKKPEAGVILYTAVGSYGHAVMLKGDKRLGFQRHIAYIRPDELAIHPKFLTHWLDSVRAKKYADRVAQGNAQKTVTLYDLSNYPVPLPSRKIQEEIADFLDQFDSRVQSEEGIKEKLKRLKKGLMQDLLTGEVRTTDKAIEVLGEVKAHG
jgi:type I restriction enzyme S subunit